MIHPRARRHRQHLVLGDLRPARRRLTGAHRRSIAAPYAAPILAVIWLIPSDRRTARGARERWLALVSGLVLAVDLALWHESIALVGAGLGTVDRERAGGVLSRVAAWLLFGDRPTALAPVLIAVVLGGVALTSGLARHDAYGSESRSPARSSACSPACCYAAFLLVYREANRTPGPRSGPLLDSHARHWWPAASSCALFDRHVHRSRPGRTAHLWLAGCWRSARQVDRLAARSAGAPAGSCRSIETSILLLGQPIFTVLWGVLLFDERLSILQWLGSAIVSPGVATRCRFGSLK